MRVVFVLLLSAIAAPAAAETLYGDDLYRVTTIRAAPGKLAALIDWFAAAAQSDGCRASLGGTPLLMRHAQGDQWDLLVITGLKSWQQFFSAQAIRDRARAAERCALLAGYDELVAFEEDLFAIGPDVAHITRLHEQHDFFHIEMFHAAPGKAGELFEQRRMENAYLAATGQTPNTIFRRAAGSDVDVFTIGFHDSFATFADPGSATDEQKESAAREAGFKDRADISFYLRSLITSHHDTLAVSVR